MTQQIKYSVIRDAVYQAEVGFEESVDEIIRPTYSGRGMYGRECLGLIFRDDAEAFRFAIGIGALIGEGRIEGLDDPYVWGSPSVDSMGRSTIYYWTSIEVTEVPVDA